MSSKQIYEYHNVDGTTEALEAVPARAGCRGCVGRRQNVDDEVSAVCCRLPSCNGIIWVEAV